MGRLSAGTVVYGLYDSAASGEHGTLAEDGTLVGWDLFPGKPGSGVTSRDVLAAYLTPDEPLAHCFVHTGLNPPDDRSVFGPPDVWIRLPERDWDSWASWAPWRYYPSQEE